MKTKKSSIHNLSFIIYLLLLLALTPQFGFSQAGTFFQCFFDLGCDLTEVEAPNNANSENLVINEPFHTIDLGYCSSQQDIIDAFEFWFDDLVDPSTTCSGVQIAKVSNRPPPLDDSYGPLIQTTQVSPELFGNDRFLYDIGYNVNPHGSTPGQIYLPGPCGGAYRYEMTILGFCEGADVPEQEVGVSLTIIVHRLPPPGVPESLSFSTCNSSAEDILTAYDTWVDGFRNTLDPPSFFELNLFFNGECDFPLAVYNATRNFGGPINIPLTNGACNSEESDFDCFQRQLRSGLTPELIMNNDEIIIYAGAQYSGAPCPVQVGQASFTVSHTQIINEVQYDVELPACFPAQLIPLSWENFMARFTYNRTAMEGCGATVIELFQKAKDPAPSSGDLYEFFDPETFDPNSFACGGQITVWYQAYEENNRSNRATTIATFKVNSVGALQTASHQVCSGENLSIELITEGSLFFNPTEQFEIVAIESSGMLAGDANQQVGNVVFADGLNADIWVNLSSSSMTVTYTIIPLLDCNPNSQSDPLCAGLSGEIEVTVEPLTCPSDMVMDEFLAQCGASPTIPVSTGCGSIEFDITPPFGGLFTLGTTIQDVYLPGFSEPICSFNVTVNDMYPPEFITFPTDYSVQCIDDVPECNSNDAEAIDCSGIPMISCVQSDLVETPCGGTITNTYTATDATGKTTIRVQTVTVDDTESPILSCPSDIDLFLDNQCLADTSTSTTGLATATDNCNEVTIRHSDQVSLGSGSDLTIRRTWTAVDPCGNSASCDQLITIRDTTSSTIVCPATVDLYLDQSCVADTSVAQNGVAMASDNCGQVTIKHQDNVVPGCGASMSITRTWTATDACGNSSTCDQIITVSDTTSPVITCPTDVTLFLDGNCVSDHSPALTGTANASDNCSTGNDIRVQHSDKEIDGCGGSLVIYRTWTATDACGNSSACTQTITVNDTTPPVIACPPDIDLGCNPDVPDAMPADITVSDNCGAVSVVAVQGTETQQGFFFTRVDTYTATDACGNQSSCTRTLWWKEDLQRPVLSGFPENIGIACEGELPPVPVVSATDNCDGPVPVSFREVLGGTNCGGVFYERIWTAIDACGNATSYRQTIRLIDEAAPFIVTPPDTTINFGESIPGPEALITDNCSRIDQDFSEVRTDHNPGAFTLVRTWTATDGCFNSASANQTIHVIDTIAPVINVVNPMLNDIPNGGSMDLFTCESPAVAMSDIEVVDLNPEVNVETFDILMKINNCQVFSYYKKWKCGYKAIDGAGNISEYSFYVYQYDTMAPALIGVPQSLDLPCDSSLHLPIVEVFAEDACNGSIPVTFNEHQILNPGDSNQVALVRTWTATDVCGNVTEANQTITLCGFDMSLAASSIGNTVWYDANANGLQDSTEVGIDSLQLNLYWIDSSQHAQIMYSTMSKTEGGRSGQFSFGYLFPGTYQIEIVLPDDLAATTMWQGDDQAIDSDINPATLMSDLIQVDTSEMLIHIDAGIILKEELSMVLSGLNGHSSQCINTISWTTNHNNNVIKFEVQRATKGGEFTTIGTVDPQLDYSQILEYEYKDMQAQSLNQYRVKVSHEESRVTYSETLDLALNCPRKIAAGVSIFPNPIVHVVNVGFDLDRGGEASLKVVDNLGRVVHQVTRKLPRGKHIEELNLRREPSGIYWIQIRIDHELITKKIVKSE